MTVTITGKVTDVTARKDSRPWKVWSPVYRQGVNGEIITVTGQSVKVVGGVVTIELEPGAAVIENPDGQRYTVTVPDEDADLWDIISAAVAFPPDTAAEALASAVTSYLEDNPPVADWDSLDNKPAVVAEGATVAAARASIGLDAPTILANWKLSNTVKLRSSLAKAKLGTGYSTHAVVGDSLSSAYTGAAFDFANSWWRRLQRALVADGVPSAGTGRVAITDYAGAPANPTDPRISVSGAWGHYDTAYGSPTAGGSITFTSDVAGTIVDVFYLAAGGPAFTVTIDGTPHTVTPAGGWSRAIDTTTGLPNTTHTVTVTAAPAGAADSVLLLGFQVRQASGIRFDNFAIKYGIAANNLHNDPGDLGAKALAVDYSSDADVVWIALGANDLATGRTASQIVADITGLRNYWPSADCVLVLEPDTGGAAGHADYVTAMRALAVTLDVPLIDLSLRYGSKAEITAAQLFGADNVHLNTVGQSDWSTVARDGIRSVVGQADGLASVKAMADSVQAAATLTANTTAKQRVQLTDNCFGRAQNYTTSGTGAGTYRAPYKVGVSGGDIQLGFGNWYVAGSPLVDTDAGSSVTFSAAFEDAAGNVFQLTFNGQTSVTLPGGGFILSDPLPVDVVQGDTVYVRVYQSSSSAYVTRFAIGQLSTGGGFTATTNLTATGSGAVTSGNTFLFAPMCIIGTPTGASRPKSVILQGDSITVGLTDGTNAGVDSGYASTFPGGGYLMRALTGNAGVIQDGFSGDSVTNFAAPMGHFRRGALTRFAKYAVCTYGRNDLTGGRTAAQIQADLLTQAYRNVARGLIGTVVTTLTPMTTSTDRWTTTANQTVSNSGINTIRIAHNAWVRGGCPIVNGVAVAVGTSGALLAGQAGHPILGYLEIADVVESARDSGLWKPAIRKVTDAAWTSGQYTITSATANFTSADQWRDIIVAGAGTAGADLKTQIAAINSTTSVTVTAAAATTVTGQTGVIGPYTADGLHPATMGNALLAAAVQAPLLALLS